MPGARGGQRLIGCRAFAGATALGLSAAVLAMAPGAPTQAAGAGDRAPRGVYPERGLALSVPDRIRVGRPAPVAVDVVASVGDAVLVFADPRGRRCPGSPLAQPPRAVPLVSEVVGEGSFRFEAIYRPVHPGQRSFCAYLTGPTQSRLRATEERRVTARKLLAAKARRTVVRALRRHDFASRVVKAVDRECNRKRRNRFACRFEARFPGYRLEGSGHVQLGLSLSYRFRVDAQGNRSVLTDENESPAGR